MAKKYKRLFEVMNYMIRAEIAAWGNTLWNKKLQKVGARDFVIIVTKNKIQAYINEADFEKLPKVGFKNFTNPLFVKNDIKNTQRVLKELYQDISYLRASHLEELSNKEVGKFAKKYFSKLIEVYGYFQTTAPWFFYKIEEKTRNYLFQKIKNLVQRENLLRDLSRPQKRFVFEEEEINWLKIIIKAKNQKGLNKILQTKNLGEIIYQLQHQLPKLFQDICQHQQAYEWLNADSNLISYTLEDCLQKLKEMIYFKKSELILKFKELTNRQKSVVKENKKLIKQYQINNKYQKLFQLFSEYAWLRFNIRFCWTQGMYYGQKLYNEIAKKAGISPEDALYCLSKELVDFLIKGTKLNVRNLQKRKKQYLIWMKNYKLNLYVGEKAKQIVVYIQKHSKIEKINEIKGEIGNPGKITGYVKIISYDKSLLPQIETMKKGDILVAGQTRPEIIVACKKAGAIVTNEGGICSHAAVVSREFKIPCIIGTKIATDIFKDRDLVEVDANRGIIRLITK